MDLIPKAHKPGISQDLIKSQGIPIPSGRPSLSFLFRGQVVLALSLLIITLLVWGGIKGYDWYLKGETEKIRDKIEEVEASQDLTLADKFIQLDKAIESVQKLAQNHIYSSQFLASLEKLTLPQVQWLGMSLDAGRGTAQLNGRAAGYSILARQIVSFEEEGWQVQVSGINLSKDGVEFETKIEFDPRILLK